MAGFMVFSLRPVATIRRDGQTQSDETLTRLSPLKWEHINAWRLPHWHKDAGLGNRKLRPLRTSPSLACRLRRFMHQCPRRSVDCAPTSPLPHSTANTSLVHSGNDPLAKIFSKASRPIR